MKPDSGANQDDSAPSRGPWRIGFILSPVRTKRDDIAARSRGIAAPPGFASQASGTGVSASRNLSDHQHTARRIIVAVAPIEA
jgi:hypothetical protein